ncbi:MAG: hypothetical protein GXZ11_01260 [Tissierellia bacterium]|nr:hypothetical protein [Tissierellia bacterium]
MEKIKETTVISDWIKAINELIEINNENVYILNSFKHGGQTPYRTELNHQQLNESHIISIRTPGKYKIELIGTGTMQILVNESEELNSYRHEIKGGEHKELLLAHGDYVMLLGDNVQEGTKAVVTLNKSLLQAFYSAVESEQDRIDAISNLAEKMATYNRELQQVKALKEEFIQSMGAIDLINTNISALSDRLTTLENK